MRVETKCENMQVYTHYRAKNAKEAHEGLELVGFPSLHYDETILCLPMIKKYQLMLADIQSAQDVYGPDIPSITGKSVP